MEEVGGLTLEQRRAIAIASARRRRAESGDAPLGDRLKKAAGETWDTYKGVAETGLAAGTGMAAGTLGLAAEAGDVVQNLFSPGVVPDPTANKKMIEGALTYEPRTEKGKQYTEGLSKVFSPIQKVGDWLKGAAGNNKQAEAAIDLGYNASLSMLPGAPGRLTKRFMRGDDAAASAMRENIGKFKEAGIDRPAVGQVTEKGASSRVTIPPAMEAEQTSQLSAKVNMLAADLSKAETPEKAGRILERGLTGEGGFVERGKKFIGQLYENADAKIPGNTPTEMASTRAFLERHATPIEGAESVSTMLQNPKLLGVKRALDAVYEAPAIPAEVEKAVAGLPPAVRAQALEQLGIGGEKAGAVPFKALKELRSKVGELLGDYQMTSDIPRGQLKQLYKALSEDMETAAKAKGPEALEATRRANRATRGFHDRIDTYLEPIVSKGIPNKIFQAAIGDMENGAEVIRTTMKSLEPEQQNAVRSVVMREMGNSGGQFHAQQWASSWKAMRPDAKSALFSTTSAKLLRELDNIAEVASQVRGKDATIWDVKNAAMKHSGEGEAATAAYLTLHSQRTLASWIFGAHGGAMLTGRLITNPKFVNWLASTTKMGAGDLSLVMVNLDKIAQDDPDIAEYRDRMMQSDQARR